MARAILAPTRPDVSGEALTFAAPTVDGDALYPGSVLLLDNTGGAAPITVTIVTGGTVAGLPVDDPTVTVATGAFLAVSIPVDPVYRQRSGTTKGYVHADYSALTLTRASVKA